MEQGFMLISLTILSRRALNRMVDHMLTATFCFETRYQSIIGFSLFGISFIDGKLFY
jgi:hypothetical protein